jgi:hypothetical protein
LSSRSTVKTDQPCSLCGSFSPPETLTGDGRTVLIVEGEKCADVAARVFNRI